MKELPELSDAAEEVLAGLWPEHDASEARLCKVSELSAASDEVMRELIEAGLVVAENGNATLTLTGQTAAANVIRRERLAERLLADVLLVSDEVATEAACKFEHLLRQGIDDEICTLLGHPQSCPHGSPIPPGPCCAQGAETAGKVISTLADLNAGEGGVIAYLHSQRREIMRRLLAMGAIPGARITLRQRYPSLVFDLGGTEIAVDEETARDIYIRLVHSPAHRPRWRNPFRFRRRGGRR